MPAFLNTLRFSSLALRWRKWREGGLPEPVGEERLPIDIRSCLLRLLELKNETLEGVTVTVRVTISQDIFLDDSALWENPQLIQLLQDLLVPNGI